MVIFSTSKKFYTNGYNIWKSDFNKNLIYNQEGYRIDSEFYMEEDNRKFKSRRNTIVPRKEVSWNNNLYRSESLIGGSSTGTSEPVGEQEPQKI